MVDTHVKSGVFAPGALQLSKVRALYYNLACELHFDEPPMCGTNADSKKAVHLVVFCAAPLHDGLSFVFLHNQPK